MIHAVVATMATGCMPRSKAAPPAAPQVSIAPALEPAPWWTTAAAACPSAEAAPVPGGPPGSTTRPGALQGGPPPQPRVWCSAGGLEHGPSTTFHPAGNPAEAGVFDDGFRVGAWTTWHPSGPMASHGHYANNQLVGIWSTWWPSGGPRDRGEWHEQHQRGMWLYWDDDARPGDSPARFVEYDTRGAEIAHGVFRDGQPREMLPVCLIGTAYPECRLVPLLDITLRWPTTRPQPHPTEAETSTVFEAGALLNVSDRHGLGFSAGFHVGDDRANRVLRARYRVWFARYGFVEVGLGRLHTRQRTGVDRGVVGSLALGAGDILSVVVEAEDVDGEPALQLGVRIGLPTVLVSAYLLAHMK